MKKFEYRKNSEGICLDNCPYGKKSSYNERVRIGSVLCSWCERFNNGDSTDTIVFCSGDE